MAETEIETPQLYLITPPSFELSRFPSDLDRVLAATEVACLRLSLASRDEDELSRAADAVREVAHAHDVAMVIDTHVVLAQRLGLDGVHLTDGSRSVRMARKELGDDAIVGAYCAQSRHDGMAAGEAGADYVAFGPVGTTILGDGVTVERDVFEWWSEVIEIPIVAEGALSGDDIADIWPVTDFLAIGEEIWSTEDPLATLQALMAQAK